jgi:hypothetical protein
MGEADCCGASSKEGLLKLIFPSGPAQLQSKTANNHQNGGKAGVFVLFIRVARQGWNTGCFANIGCFGRFVGISGTFAAEIS